MTGDALDIDLGTNRIKTINGRRVLNSHLGFTNEFVIELENGKVGVGASSQGETISVYEDRSGGLDTKNIIDEIRHERSLDSALSQSDFDRFLQSRIRSFGRNNCWALSLAFFNAMQSPLHKFWLEQAGTKRRDFPRLCLNVLNGGNHAYTNPILSDFHEYLIVPRFDDVKKVIDDITEVIREVRNSLASCDRVRINENLVYRFKERDNAQCIAFLQRILDRSGLSEDYDIMIDASAGDLWADNGYKFALTDGSFRSTDGLNDYWMDLIEEYGIGFLEDPFGEYDHEGWKRLTGGQSECKIIGDNLYSSDADRIEQGSSNGWTNGVIIKPNQAGTVSAVIGAIEASKRMDQVAITSHRSISTESTFLALLTVIWGVGYMKIGPLFTDYSSIMRLNEIIRLTGVELD